MDEFDIDTDDMDFDFQEFSLEDLSNYDGKGGWTSGSYDDLDFNLDPTWLD